VKFALIRGEEIFMPQSSTDVTRPMVKGLFVATCVLSIVSWYTTEQGMALYLSVWFALLASVGVQGALVLVAWLIGVNKFRRALLSVVYAITATVSIAFSYVSLFTWFSARERPAAVERRLYDELNNSLGKTQQLVTAASAEAQKHVLALGELGAAEKSVGFISRAQDSDPYLAAVRDAVAREAQTYSVAYPEGAGPGVRYTAFDRYTKLARQSADRLQAAEREITEFRAQLKPLDSTESQLRAFRQLYDGVPWNDVTEALHAAKIERPPVPTYTDFVDRSVTGQEDLLVAFRELFVAPTARHVFSFALAAFIDIIVFLLAFASGPYFFGSSEERWIAASAALDGLDQQIFVRGLLNKIVPTLRGMARLEPENLSGGEQQLCLVLVSKGLALIQDEDGKQFYVLDQTFHEQLLECLATQALPLRASAAGV
jgi:hypothetical protein